MNCTFVIRVSNYVHERGEEIRPRLLVLDFLGKDTFYQFCCLLTIFNEKAVKRLKATTFNQQIIQCKNLKA